MTATLAVRTAESIEELEELESVEIRIRELINDGDLFHLEEARVRAEALALYERRKNNLERERHFWTCGVLCDAGIGVLSFSDDSVVEQGTKKADFRVLAAALERGKLLEECSEFVAIGSGSRTSISWYLRNKGYHRAPGKTFGKSGSVTWVVARKLAIARGLSLGAIPPDRAYVEARRKVAKEQSRRMHNAYVAQKRLARMKRREGIIRSAKERGGRIDEAYSLIRRACQILHDAQSEFDASGRETLDDIFHCIHYIEDDLGTLLRAV